MIEYLTKDLTTVDNGLILHGCNCSGGFGSGVAGAIRRKWPKVYETFKETGTGRHLLGTVTYVSVFKTRDGSKPEIIVGNGYTQERYGNDGKRYADLPAVALCIKDAIMVCAGFDYDLYMPKIGCGLGGLSWDDEVKPILEKASLEFKGVNIYVCDL